MRVTFLWKMWQIHNRGSQKYEMIVNLWMKFNGISSNSGMAGCSTTMYNFLNFKGTSWPYDTPDRLVSVLVFPTGRDSATFWDNGTEGPSLSWDKGTMGPAQNLAKGWDGTRFWQLSHPIPQNKTGQSRKGRSKTGKRHSKTGKRHSKTEKDVLKQERMF